MKKAHRDNILAGLFALFVGALFIGALAPCCGSGIDPSDLARIRSVTCPSVCAAYADAVDAGVGVSPEDVALMEVCECGHE